MVTLTDNDQRLWNLCWEAGPEGVTRAEMEHAFPWWSPRGISQSLQRLHQAGAVTRSLSHKKPGLYGRPQLAWRAEQRRHHRALAEKRSSQ